MVRADGNAVFDFAKTHALTIVKKTTDASAMGQTFRFKVTKKAEGASPETRVAEVKVDKRQQENGETWYVGSVQFAAPTGIYTVEEDYGLGMALRAASSSIARQGAGR